MQRWERKLHFTAPVVFTHLGLKSKWFFKDILITGLKKDLRLNKEKATI